MARLEEKQIPQQYIDQATEVVNARIRENKLKRSPDEKKHENTITNEERARRIQDVAATLMQQDSEGNALRALNQKLTEHKGHDLTEEQKKIVAKILSEQMRKNNALKDQNKNLRKQREAEEKQNPAVENLRKLQEYLINCSEELKAIDQENIAVWKKENKVKAWFIKNGPAVLLTIILLSVVLGGAMSFGLVPIIALLAYLFLGKPTKLATDAILEKVSETNEGNELKKAIIDQRRQVTEEDNFDKATGTYKDGTFIEKPVTDKDGNPLYKKANDDSDDLFYKKSDKYYRAEEKNGQYQCSEVEETHDGDWVAATKNVANRVPLPKPSQTWRHRQSGSGVTSDRQRRLAAEAQERQNARHHAAHTIAIPGGS